MYLSRLALTLRGLVHLTLVIPSNICMQYYLSNIHGIRCLGFLHLAWRHHQSHHRRPPVHSSLWPRLAPSAPSLAPLLLLLPKPLPIPQTLKPHPKFLQLLKFLSLSQSPMSHYSNQSPWILLPTITINVPLVSYSPRSLRSLGTHWFGLYPAT
jgi:hypothetical protein